MPTHDYIFLGSGPNPHQKTLLRRVLSLSVLGFFLVFLLARGIGWVADGGQMNALELEAFASGKKDMPDFGKYVHSRTLRFDERAVKGHTRRTIFVGDIHGQSYSLLSLLNTTSYDTTTDTLIHVGDLVAKGTRAGSSQVLDYVVQHDTVGVRGNHDQKVIEWRGWQEWIQRFEGGKDWLARVEGRWTAKHGDFVGGEDEDKASRTGVDPAEPDANDFLEAGKKKDRRKQDKKFRSLIPPTWKLFSEHYFLARDLTPAHYAYLLSLPLILHIPSEHAFVVHAGMLPYDITKRIDGARQPLARMPRIHGGGGTVDELREKQEVSVLDNVPQNGEPWALLNMRNILHDHSIISNTKHGRAWYSAWNQLMPKCSGYNVSSSSPSHSVQNAKWLPCKPMSVIYGHTASRKLDIHRWTLGLDSGCVYGRRLSALVIERGGDERRRGWKEDVGDEEEDREDDEHWDDEDEDNGDDNEDVKENGSGKVKFGDDGSGRIVSVSCHKHRQKGHYP